MHRFAFVHIFNAFYSLNTSNFSLFLLVYITFKQCQCDFNEFFSFGFLFDQIQEAEMKLTKAQNMIEHEDEIFSRPKKTWFMSEKDKQTLKEKSKAEALSNSDELNDLDDTDNNNQKRGKKRKKIDDSDMKSTKVRIHFLFLLPTLVSLFFFENLFSFFKINTFLYFLFCINNNSYSTLQYLT
jgi:hypothetical protein